MKKKSPFTELLKDEKLTKDSYLFNIEHSRISEDQLFLTFEVFNHKKELVFKFKIQIDVTENFKTLGVGKSSNKVGLISLSNKSFFQIVKEGIENAVADGRVPFLPGSFTV